MASVFFRGTKSRPRWYARFRDSAGVWRARRVRVEKRADADAIARQLEAKEERRRYGLEAPESAALLFSEAAKRWEAGLVNRSAYDDRSRLRVHLVPRFGSMRLADLTLAVLMGWLDEMRGARRLSAGTQRHLLNIVSRIFAWAIERGLASLNPVRQIPPGRRPQHAPKRDVPWLRDDGAVRALMAELPKPFNLMLYLGNRAGLRLGEICGLRLSDLDELAQGAIRVRFSYSGPLKEDHAGAGKVKWTPAPVDAPAVLGPWLEQRRAAGAEREAFLFERERGRHFRKEHVEYRWERAIDALGLDLTWYQATRHSFASRNLSRGVALDEVAAALGHSTPAVTARHYAHFIRKTFSPLMTAGLSDAPAAPDGGGKVLPLGGRRPAVSPAPAGARAGAGIVRPAGTAGGPKPASRRHRSGQEADDAA
jgi:integrase